MNRENKNHIEHHPPSDDAIREFVQSVSQTFASIKNDDGYLDPETTYGLFAFIKLVARIKANQQNRLHGSDHFDKHSKSGYPVEK